MLLERTVDARSREAHHRLVRALHRSSELEKYRAAGSEDRNAKGGEEDKVRQPERRQAEEGGGDGITRAGCVRRVSGQGTTPETARKHQQVAFRYLQPRRAMGAYSSVVHCAACGIQMLRPERMVAICVAAYLFG